MTNHPSSPVITIGNRRDGAVGEYVGRPSPLGNPFQIGKDGCREEVIEKYKGLAAYHLFKRTPSVVNELQRLFTILLERQTLTLVCWCDPLDCHARIVKEILLQWLACNHDPNQFPPFSSFKF